DAQYFRFSLLGGSSTAGMLTELASSGAIFRLRDGVIDNCGHLPSINVTHADCACFLTNVKWTNGLGTYLTDINGSNAIGAGTRLVEHCTTTGKFLSFLSPRDFTVHANNLMHGLRCAGDT